MITVNTVIFLQGSRVYTAEVNETTGMWRFTDGGQGIQLSRSRIGRGIITDQDYGTSADLKGPINAAFYDHRYSYATLIQVLKL